MDIPILITFVLLSLAAIILFFKRKFEYWKNEGLTTPAFSFFFGHVKNTALGKSSIAECIKEVYVNLKSENVVHGGMYLLFTPVYVPMNLDIINKILIHDFENFMDRGFYFNERDDPLSAHLINLEGKEWKILRKKFTPTFTPAKIKAMFEIFTDCSKNLNKVIEMKEGDAIYVRDVLERYTSDIVGRCALGVNCNSLENTDCEFIKMVKLFSEKNPVEIAKQMMLFAYPKLMKKFGAVTMPTRTSKFFIDVVKETVNYREKNNIRMKDFMQLLIELKNAGGYVENEKICKERTTKEDNTITVDQIAAQVFIFFTAGFETSSTLLSFCLYELAVNKNMQTKLRIEIKESLQKCQGVLTYDAVIGMSYLHKVLNETLRKYPPVPALNRICKKDYKVPGTSFVIKEGVRVLIPVYGIHNDPEYYPNPEKFDPERFSEECVQERHPCAFLPFGDGPRFCIGVKFGMIQAKVGMINLIRQFEVEMNERTPTPLNLDPKYTVLAGKDGPWLSFKKLNA